MSLRPKSKFTILLYTLIITSIVVSCSPNITDFVDDTSQVEVNSIDDLLSFYKENPVNSVTPDASSSRMKETEGLIYILESSLDSNSNDFIGIENKRFIEEHLLYPEDAYDSFTVSDWNRLISILFTNNNNNNISIKKYLAGYKDNDFINRQDAIYSLMKLLSSTSSIIIDRDASSLHKSQVLTDIDRVAEEKQIFIRNAFCLGFTDLNVEATKVFRPNDFLSHYDSISILYRIFVNLGFPINKISQDEQSGPSESELPLDSEELFSNESIYNEYNDYIDKLNKRERTINEKRLTMLRKANTIISKETTIDQYSPVLSKEKWIDILIDVFGLEQDDINLYMEYIPEDTIPYHSAAIIIFNNKNLLGSNMSKEATEKELEEARALVSQFDTAIDLSAFSQMLASGLLDGIYQTPGFTPQAPISNTEALVLVKRIVEMMDIN